MREMVQQKNIITSLFFLFVLIPSFSIAQSSPPLKVNDPGTPGHGNWEINILSSFEHSSLTTEWEAIVFDINYGIGTRIQLTIESPLVYVWEDELIEFRGVDGLGLGMKYRFLDQDADGSDISIYPQFYFPRNSKNECWEFNLPFEWHKEWPELGLTIEIGQVWVNRKIDRWEAGFGIAYLLNKIKLLASEHIIISKDPLEIVEPIVEAGVIWEVIENLSVYFSVGKTLNHNRDGIKFTGLGGIQILY